MILSRQLFLRTSLGLLVMLGGAGISNAQTATASPTLARHYTEGEKLVYHMRGDNAGWIYEVTATAIVKKNAAGHFVEEYAWLDFKTNPAMTLSDASLNFRQTLSLDPANPPSMPDLSKVQPFLIGPLTDMMTFYSDLWLAIRQNNLNHAGDHTYAKFGGPASWADGNYVTVGEDSIDFDLTLKDVDSKNQVATLLVRHVPPTEPKIKLPAPWMHDPVTDTPNNWIEVKKNNAGKFIAEVGKETFDVEIKTDLKSGKIISATLDNPVIAHKRECSDAALLDCGAVSNEQIHRRIEIQSEAQ